MTKKKIVKVKKVKASSKLKETKPKKEVALHIDNVYKSFKLPTEHSNQIKQVFINWTKGIKGYRTQEVLKGVSFDVYKGDFLGIVGRNGSGKSTLLKVISGIYAPTKGSVQINGKLISFIELGVGFSPELTGRENVYLNGAMLGFTPKEIDDMYDDIVDFAELHDFMDQKLKNYSSGMQVRLAFSVAIKARGDILILDEVLAVGDEAFQKKCNDYFFETKKSGKTIVLVTHNMAAVRKFCNRAIFINNGHIEAEGDPNMVANKYSGLFRKEYIEKLKRKTGKSEEELKLYSETGVNVSQVSLKQRNAKDQWKDAKLIDFRKDYQIGVKVNSPKDFEDAKISVRLTDQAGRIINVLTTRKTGEKYTLKKGDNIVKFDVENILNEGDFTAAVYVYDKDNAELLHAPNVLKFTVAGQDVMKYSKASLAHPHYDIELA